MRKMLLILVLIGFALAVQAQLYFPPTNSTTWDTLAPSELGWCENHIDSLYNFLNSNNTRAFILLKDGKIVLERYFNGHDENANWYWASAGKSLTAFTVGIAQQEGLLDITDAASTHLGSNWTSCSTVEEDQINIWNQLTMTTGLDDGVVDPFCTSDSCLKCIADAGTRWAYHNGPYTLLDSVLEQATGQSLNLYTTQKVKSVTGMNGLYIPQGFNNVFYSTARSMARFGLLVLNKGNWDGTTVMTDSTYFSQMLSTSQSLNESYGYLWWLNGKNSHMLPQTQFVFQGSISPDAPVEMVAAVGKNGQFINVVPSEQLVWIRMGDSPDNSLVPTSFNNDIWKHINKLECNPLEATSHLSDSRIFKVYPNPTTQYVFVTASSAQSQQTGYTISTVFGESIINGSFSGLEHRIDLSELTNGIYLLTLFDEHSKQTFQIIKQ